MHSNRSSNGHTDADAELRLIAAMEPFRGFALASALHAFFETGVFDALLSTPNQPVHALVADHGLVPDRVDALLRFLAVEGVVIFDGDRAAVTDRARDFGDFRAWYEMLVGGYARVFAGLPDGLRGDAGLPRRDGARVAAGSAGVSLRCSLPMVRRLLNAVPARLRTIVDVGCGSPEYLQRICEEADCQGIGIEPDAEAIEAGNRLIASRVLDRVRLTRGAAQDGFAELAPPDVVLIAFVLHEVYGQSGEAGLREFLGQLAAWAPEAYLIVVEVDWRQDDPGIMQHGYARNYYNGYYLAHPYTRQRLAPKSFWDDLFREEGFEIVQNQTTDRNIDSTGLELGYLLQRAGDN